MLCAHTSRGYSCLHWMEPGQQKGKEQYFMSDLYLVLGFDQIPFSLAVFSADTHSHCFYPTSNVSLASGLIFTSQCFHSVCGSNVLQDLSTISWEAAVPLRLSSGLLQTLLKAPTASTSITLQSTKGMGVYRTLTNKLILTMLLKITHWWGPEGSQAKKITVNLPSATHPTECGMWNVSLPDEPNFPDWTKGLGLYQSCNFLPWEASSRQ